MKRFHVHLTVADLAASIAFYNRLFAAGPTRVESDYAKWMLSDPPVNFAISTRGDRPGLDHLGLQVDNADDLATLKAQAQAADMALLDEGETTCCYARSDKYWITDPQGLAWEQFHTLGTVPTFHGENSKENSHSAPVCCAPDATESEGKSEVCCAPAASGCCAPATTSAGVAAGCCGPSARQGCC
ncbi:MAG: ArsI/CadI family heavy metal resistance metalloenzyme [Burkholderiales bacterium]|nr:ArsI/CadI family heavy metal resistance metalloenzyme [Burkholderiales bacterium]